jgi:hypothetical protein
MTELHQAHERFSLKGRDGQEHRYIHSPLPIEKSIRVGLALAPLVGAAVGELVEGLVQKLIPAMIAAAAGGPGAGAASLTISALMDIKLEDGAQLVKLAQGMDWKNIGGSLGSAIMAQDPALVIMLCSSCSRDGQPLSHPAHFAKAFEKNPVELMKLVGKVIQLEGFVDFGATLPSASSTAGGSPTAPVG